MITRICTIDFVMYFDTVSIDATEDKRSLKFEPPRGKTNNMVSEQVRHKSACTSTEKG